VPTFFCPACWGVTAEHEVICPHCGADVPGLLASKSYAERLADALHHPEPATRLRVAYLLGLCQEAAAVPALATRAAESDDLYVSLQCLTALARIGTSEAWEAVASFSTDRRKVVAARAATLLRRRPSQGSG
jgi:HEAT repeat protein